MAQWLLLDAPVRRACCAAALRCDADVRLQATSLHFDFSGQYLAVGGMDARVYSVKGWNLVKSWQDNTAPVTAIKFGSDARFLAAGSLDRHLRILA